MERFKDNIYTYRSIIDASPFPVYLCVGEHLIVTIANEAALKVWGKTKDIIGKSFHEALPELENQPFKKLLNDVYHTGKTHSFDEKQVNTIVDGKLQTFYFKFSYQPFKDQAGNITGVFCFANDVTELVLARQHLAACEESARLVIEAGRLGTFDKDLISGKVRWDERCRELFDIADGDDVNYQNDFLPRVHPDDQKRVDDQIRNFAFVQNLSGGNFDMEYRTTVAEDQSVRWLKSRGKVFFDTNSLPVRFIGSVLDITDIKQAGEKSAMLSAIIESSYDGIMSKNLDGVIESWNEAAERIFGYTAEEMIGQSVFKIIPLDRVDEEHDFLSRLKSGDRVQHFETKRLKKDGKVLDISLTISPIKNELGDIIGHSKIARDITDQKMLEMRKNDFITIASHELKTPLTTIKSYVQLLLAKARSDQDSFKIDALSRVEKQTNQMSTLIQSFLNNAKLAEGKLNLLIERFEAREMLLEAVNNATLISRSHRIVLKDCEALAVMADRNKIEQVVENLITNAIKYSPHGTTVTVSCSKRGKHVTIAVSDTGIGIAEEDQLKLFERFYRVENPKHKNVAGFGIGLYLVAEILRLHQSKIFVESKVNVGSKFYFRLPVANEAKPTEL